ncbi:MAG: hypothetical protein JWQ38_3030 [Flavipsychrobacter sp.]|nr:hypothetical protein [Flavipsychrobacter sp.]
MQHKLLQVKYFFSSLLIIISTGLYSCGGTIKCQDEPISLAFNGFDSLTLHRVILIKYTKNTGFTQIIDSVTSGTGTSQYAIDTNGFKINNLTYAVITPAYDYGVYIASTQRLYKIHGVSFKQATTHTSCKLCENDCKNNLSFYVNDSLFEHVGSTYDHPYVHIYR